MNHDIEAVLKMKNDERQAALASAGFRDGRLAAENLEAAAKVLGPDTAGRAAAQALLSPNPDSAMNFLEMFLSSLGDNFAEKERFTAHIDFFMRIFGSSEFLSGILVKRPTRWLDLVNSEFLRRERPLSAMKVQLMEELASVDGQNTLQMRLRLFKQQEMLRIGARDLLGLGPLEEITAELSSLASATLDAAYEVCKRLLLKDYGTPWFRDEDGRWKESGFVVLGMGKLGGNELNFSSDIDLIYLYSSDEGETRGGTKGHTLYEYYCKLAEILTKAISAKTDEGFVFRVDLRLRPDGQNGPIVNSIRSAETYYESWGETWERSAMLKARPIAGEISLGDRFLKDIEPFIYRKYLDFSTIEDIKEMKVKIDRDLALKPGMWDVKLGSGGIREIEFLVQATQLIHAGKDRSIRRKNTLESLRVQTEKGLLSPDEAETLSSAYRFLRTVEHRIQIDNERQTHMLPSKTYDLERLARRCGFNTLKEFREVLAAHSGNVERLFDGIFHEPSKGLEDIPAEISSLFSEGLEREKALEGLAKLGFEEIETAYRSLISLRDGTTSSRISQKGKAALRRLGPRLIYDASKSPDPDMSIANLERFLSAVGAKGSFYSLLVENQKMISFLAVLFGSSDFLSQFLIGHPELLDTLLRADTVTPFKSMEEMATELERGISAADGYEEILDSVRRFRNVELIRIGINDIAEESGLFEVFSQLTSLAEISIKEALKASELDLRARFGKPSCGGEDASLAVIGMGKLGGGEMNYSSDLDLIFIYSGPGETCGPKVITNQEYFAKLAQKTISFLTLQTREGYLYKVDTRLRPSGSSGALVSSMDSFIRYHNEVSRLWERQALIKARFVGGDRELGERIMEEISSFVYERGIDDTGRKEMIHLRERMEKELAKEGADRYNVKTGRGGIVDIDFSVQYLQLKFGVENNRLRTQGTLKAIEAFEGSGLLDEDDRLRLKEAYLFLMKTENRLRILHNISTDDMDLEQKRLGRLVRRLGYHEREGLSGTDLFLREYRESAEEVRAIFNKILSVDKP